jgi:hypothetical protein
MYKSQSMPIKKKINEKNLKLGWTKKFFGSYFQKSSSENEWRTKIVSETFLITGLQLKSNEKKLKISKKLL